MVVVATAFVTEARSKMLAVATNGEPASYVKRPSAQWAINSPRRVTAIAQAGKAWAAIALSRIENAPRKVSSCALALRTRKAKPAGGFWVAVKVVSEG